MEIVYFVWFDPSLTLSGDLFRSIKYWRLCGPSRKYSGISPAFYRFQVALLHEVFFARMIAIWSILVLATANFPRSPLSVSPLRSFGNQFELGIVTANQRKSSSLSLMAAHCNSDLFFTAHSGLHNPACDWVIFIC
jgi:hypothetical protein